MRRLSLLSLLCVPLGCSDSGDSGLSRSEAGAELSAADLEKARELYASNNCALCHGSQGQGAPPAGPALRGLGDFWDQAQLRAFLADPVTALKHDPRLAEQAKQYMMPMQIPDQLTESGRALLAKLLLSW